MHNSTNRFSTRVEAYIQSRPSYPPAVLDVLREECGLTSETVIADIGSGTGLLTELLLRNGNPVYGVEPNREMREAGERLLAGYPRFTSIAGSAEETTLPDRSVELIAAGQAFHWFDRVRARAEFARILKPGGWIVLIWNDRRTDSTPFLRAYEELLQTHGTDYKQVNHKQVDEAALRAFFGGEVQLRAFDNRQVFDWEGFYGRVRSSSYTPEPSDPAFAPMQVALRALFDQFQVDGRVVFEYDTTVYYGQLAGDSM